MIRNRKLVYGVGINDADYVVTNYEVSDEGVRRQVWVCPFYKRWRSMLQRCYDEKLQQRQPTYVGCEVVSEWHRFSVFKLWMVEQDWLGNELDKDLLGSGKLYSPDTCCFVSPDLNKFLLDRFACRGDYPIGVSWHIHRKKFQASCRNPVTKRMEYLGLYACPEDAHDAWKRRKHAIACELSKHQADQRVSDILTKLYV